MFQQQKSFAWIGNSFSLAARFICSSTSNCYRTLSPVLPCPRSLALRSNNRGEITFQSTPWLHYAKNMFRIKTSSTFISFSYKFNHCYSINGSIGEGGKGELVGIVFASEEGREEDCWQFSGYIPSLSISCLPSHRASEMNLNEKENVDRLSLPFFSTFIPFEQVLLNLCFARGIVKGTIIKNVHDTPNRK